MTTIIRKRYGYIKTSHNGTWVEEFFIYKKFRGQGYARKLAAFLPAQCSLLAHPLYGTFGEVPGLSNNALINFYKSLGFRLAPDEDGNNIMTRKLSLADRFPNDFWGRKARDRARREAEKIRQKSNRNKKSTSNG